jgi:hypothetical protein
LQIQAHVHGFLLGPSPSGACRKLRLPNTSQKIGGQVFWVYEQLWRKQFLYWVSVTLWKSSGMWEACSPSWSEQGPGRGWPWVCPLPLTTKGAAVSLGSDAILLHSLSYDRPYHASSGQGDHPQPWIQQGSTLKAEVRGHLGGPFAPCYFLCSTAVLKRVHTGVFHWEGHQSWFPFAFAMLSGECSEMHLLSPVFLHPWVLRAGPTWVECELCYGLQYPLSGFLKDQGAPEALVIDTMELQKHTAMDLNDCSPTP